MHSDDGLAIIVEASDAFVPADSRSVARMAINAITTRNSINVEALHLLGTGAKAESFTFIQCLRFMTILDQVR